MDYSNLSLAELKALVSEKETAVKDGRTKIEEIFTRHIENAMNEARKETAEKIENGQLDDSEIDTKTKYFSVGLNFNHKVEDNKKDKGFICNVQHRTKAEFLKAKKKQEKDTTEKIKLTSYKKTKQFENATK